MSEDLGAPERLDLLKAELARIRDARDHAQREVEGLPTVEAALAAAGRERDAAISAEVLALQDQIEQSLGRTHAHLHKAARTGAKWANIKRRRRDIAAVVGPVRMTRLEEALVAASALQEGD